MRAIAIIVVILGLAAIVVGILFVTQAADARQKVADSVAPVTLDELDDKYDTAKARADVMRAEEEPLIQTGQALPSAMYNYLSIQRTSLGLARANVGVSDKLRVHGLVDIGVGLGLVLAGLGLLRKAQA